MDARVIEVSGSAPEQEVDPRVVALAAPEGPAAEQFRLLHLRIERLRRELPLQAVAFTSAVAGEGKTLTAANLAASAVRRGKSTILVDCDLRRARLAGLFGVADRPGLAELLAGGTSIEAAIRRGPSGLGILPAGSPPADPGGLFAGGSLRDLLDRLRREYEEIVLDLPPVLPFADALAAAAVADGVVVVVRNGETPAELVEEAVAALADTRLLGCVLTACDDAAVAFRRYHGNRR